MNTATGTKMNAATALHRLRDAAMRKLAEDSLVEDAGIAIRLGYLRKTLVEPSLALTELDDATLIRIHNTTLCIGDLKARVGTFYKNITVPPKSDLQRRGRDSAAELKTKEVARLDRILSLQLDSGLARFARTPPLTSPDPDIESTQPFIQCVCHQGNKCLPGSLLVILGDYLGDIPGQVFLDYVRFDGQTVRLELTIPTGPGFGRGWYPGLVAAIIPPELSEYRNQDARIRLVRSDGAEASPDEAIPLLAQLEIRWMAPGLAGLVQYLAQMGLASDEKGYENGVFWWAHRGFGDGVDRLSLPPLKNDWTVAFALEDHDHDNPLGDSEVLVMPEAGDTSIRYSARVHVGRFFTIPLINVPAGAPGGMVHSITIALIGPRGTPFI